ncbi:MAG: glycosyltransferase family 2 protein [Patescibacteria group bacterium]
MRKNIDKSLVSVIMTVYNAQDFVQEAVVSILEQTYSNLELIIVNDGSNDETLKILNNLRKNDSRIRVISLNRNYGPSYASNIGIKEAKGTYIARMDADDVSLPTRIQKQVNYLEKHPKTVILGGQCKLINKDGKSVGRKNFPTKHNDIYKSLFKINPIQHPSCMINVDLIGKDRFFYNTKHVLAHDLELIFYLSQFGKLANLKDSVLCYRLHSDSLSLKNPKNTFKATLSVRKNSVKKYGYKTDFVGRLMNLVQTIVVYFLPREAIYPIYRILRMNKNESLNEVFADVSRFVKSSFSTRFSFIKTNLDTYLAK